MTASFPSSHGKIAYTDTQVGAPALILMHGLPTSKALWHPVLPYLNPQYRLITFDLNNYGESEKIGQAITHQERAGVLDELRAYLNLNTFNLIAHDLGASVAIDYMGKYAARVEKLVLMSPPVYPDFPLPAIVSLMRIPGVGEQFIRLARKPMFALALRMGLVHKKRLTPELLQAMSKGYDSPEGEAALLRNLRWGEPKAFFAEYPRIIRSIPVPVLVIQGEEDVYIPVAHAKRLRDDLPDAKLILIPDGGHFLPLDTPEQVAEAINGFIP